MDIAIVSCCMEEGNLSFPLGALCIESAIASHARLRTWRCTLHSHFLSDSPEDAARILIEHNPSIVGFSVYLWNRRWFDRFAAAFKEEAPDIPLFAGGTEPTANPSTFDLDSYRFLVLGEGEEATTRALLDWMEGREPSGPGIMSKAHPEPSFATIEQLRTLTSPFLGGFADPLLSEGGQVLWELTRGCPFSCTFCFESRGIRSVRNYPMARIEAELDYLLQHKVGEVFVLDPTFNLDAKRAKRILRLLAEKAGNTHFTFEIRAELLDEEMAQLFSRCNCSLQIGLQSASKTVANTVGRAFEPSSFSQHIAMLNRYGIVFGLDLIMGLPGDTYRGFRESLEYAVSLRPSNIDIFPLAVLPGTRLAEQADSFGLTYRKESPYTIERTPTFSEAELEQAFRLQQACDRFYTRGQACMWMHVLCKATRLEAVTILELFDTFCAAMEQRQGIEIDSQDIYLLQERFVRALLKKRDKDYLLPALLSFMELHQGVAFFQETGESPTITLEYDLDALAELDDMSPETFVRQYKKERSRQYLIASGEDGAVRFFAGN